MGRPIIGYVVAIAVILLMALNLSFMAVVSTSLATSAVTMASLLVLIALFVGLSVADKAAS